MRILKIDTDNKKLIFDGERTNIGWTSEVEEDLKIMHRLDIKTEIVSALLSELNRIYCLSKPEKLLAAFVIKQHLMTIKC